MASKIWLGLILSAVLYLFFGPGPYDAVAFSDIQPRPDYTPFIKISDVSKSITIISSPHLQFPEDLLVDNDYIYTGGFRGKLYRIDKNEMLEEVTQSKGQITRIIKRGEIFYFLDVLVGICKFDERTKRMEVLVDAKDYNFLNNFALSKDGKIYFSDVSSKYGLDDYILDSFEGRPYGRLLSFEPETNKTETLIDKIHFANGVELSED